LPSGATVSGPAIIEQADTTTVIPPGYGAVVDRSGNLRIRRVE
jgi:N-methylhydantoinase A/oxoprolinase/acetone carboxylase beta subunit